MWWVYPRRVSPRCRGDGKRANGDGCLAALSRHRHAPLIKPDTLASGPGGTATVTVAANASSSAASAERGAMVTRPSSELAKGERDDGG